MAPTFWAIKFMKAGYHARWLEEEVGTEKSFYDGHASRCDVAVFFIPASGFATQAFMNNSHQWSCWWQSRRFRLVASLFQKQTGVRRNRKNRP